MFKSFYADFSKTKIHKEPVMTLSELSREIGVSVYKIKAKIKKENKNFHIMFEDKSGKFYSRKKLLEWAKNNFHEVKNDS